MQGHTAAGTPALHPRRCAFSHPLHRLHGVLTRAAETALHALPMEEQSLETPCRHQDRCTGGHHLAFAIRPGAHRRRGARPAALPQRGHPQRGAEPGRAADTAGAAGAQRVRGKLGRNGGHRRRPAQRGAAAGIHAHRHARAATGAHHGSDGGAGTGPAQGQRIHTEGATDSAMARPVGPAPREHCQGLAHAVRCADHDGGRGRCARDPQRPAAGGRSPPCPQAGHLPPRVRTGAACAAARGAARPARRGPRQPGPGTGGHRAAGHRAAGRVHRCTDAKRLAAPLVLGALPALRTRMGARRLHGTLAAVVPGVHCAAGRACGSAHLRPGMDRLRSV